jgi:probable biosynthetic protein (TIGR04098 family)
METPDPYPELSFTVGMPNMAPDQLSEVELLKIYAEFQWVQLGAALECPSHLLVNEAGDRLYASVVQVESRFGLDDTISNFQEGDVVHARGHVQFYARSIVEGWAVFGKEAVPRETVTAIKTKADLAGIDAPWICMTMAIVARLADNNRLKTFRPMVDESVDVPEAGQRPTGLVEHEHVMRGGDIEPLCDTANLVPLRPVDESPIAYPVSIESDLNGAGLLYFARYIAMMNYAERIFLSERLKRPFSLQLNRFLSTEHRRSYIYANAGEADRVLIYCKASAIEPSRPPVRKSDSRSVVLRFLFEFELYRESDRVLMAKSLVTKALVIPNKFKSLHGESRRFITSITE